MKYLCPKCKRRFNWNTYAAYGKVSPCCGIYMIESDMNVVE